MNVCQAMHSRFPCDQCESKLKALQAELQASLGPLIQAARSEISSLWEAMHYSASHKQTDFQGFLTPNGM